MKTPMQPRSRRSLTLVVAIVCAFVLGSTATAVSAGLITGGQIKNNTVTTKDIKDKTLKLKDFKPSEREKLRGPAGAAGASAFAPPPSGTVIQGAGLLNNTVSAGGVTLRLFTDLPFTPASGLTEAGVARNLYFGDTTNPGVPAAAEDPTKCPGTAAAPAPTAGVMCLYLTQASNVANNSIEPFGGLLFDADAGDLEGYTVRASSSVSGEMDVRWVWAYQAP